MITYRDPKEIPPGRRAVAIGVFDGVHAGHRRVVAAAMEAATRLDVKSCVVTFDPHPQRVVHPERAPQMIATIDARTAALKALGPDEVVVLGFDAELASLTPAEFCQEILSTLLGAVSVAVGANFRFGAGAEGDAEYLRLNGAEFGFSTRVVGVLEADGEPVSSTRVRELIRAGDVETVARLLGRPFELRGIVEHGASRGRRLGFRTANLAGNPELVIPARGIYAAVTEDGTAAAISIGTRPTFEDSGPVVVEAHLLDLDRDPDLYGREIVLRFLKRLRPEVKFDTEAELTAAIEADVAEVRAVTSDARLGD